MAAEPEGSARMPVMLEIPLDAIEPHPASARTFPVEDSEDLGLVELAASIKAVGLLEPIVVRETAAGMGRFQILAGERRWRAMRLVKDATTIAAIVRDVGDREALEILVTENLQRKDLSPLEEARGVRALVDQAGWTVVDVAERLGRSLHWVAQRARLTSLSPAWQAETGNPKSIISHWPAGLLVLVARIEPHIQDGILDEWADEDSPPSRHQLERELADLTRELRKAPWKLGDAAFYPEAGACVDCHKRSACHPGLFEDEDPQKPEKTDRCLDATCWTKKLSRHLVVRESELREQHKDLVLVHGESIFGTALPIRKDALDEWRVEPAKKGEMGAIPALVVDGKGAGILRWIKPARMAGGARIARPRGADGKPAPATLAQRRASLDRRRKVKAVELVRVAIEGVKPYPQPPEGKATQAASLRLLLAMAAVFGTKHQRNSSQWAGYRDGSGQDLSGKPQRAWDALARLREDVETCAAELWREVRLVLLERLAYQGTPTDIKKLWADTKAVCQVLGIDAEAALRQAVEAIPEPKLWAALKADGTAKGSTRAKGKRKSKARKAKPEENEAEAEL